PGAPHRLPGFGRRKGHALAILRRRRDVEEPRDRTRRLAERRVGGDVLDFLTVDKNLPPVVERAEILGTGSHHIAALFEPAKDSDLTPLRISSTSLCGVTGVCAMRTPKGCKACSIAEMIAAAAGIVLTSPAPLAPSGLSGDGVSLNSAVIAGTSVALGSK